MGIARSLRSRLVEVLRASLLLAAACLSAQTEADYLRANSLRQKMQGLALNVTGPMNWIGATDRFWYRKSVAGGNVFMVMNAATLEKSAAFDHEQAGGGVWAKNIPG